jgi:hypothetical protein
MSVPLLHFEKILNNDGDVRFINVYKGVPISYSGKVIEIGVTSVRFTVHSNQILCIRHEGLSHLVCPDLPKVVKGNYLSSDIPAQTVLLTAFEESQHSIGTRTYIRVHPKDLIDVIIISDSNVNREVKTLRGSLVDISIKGAAIYLSLSIANLNALSKGDTADVVLFLPDSKHREQQISLKGVLKNITQSVSGKRSVRLGLQTFPDRTAETFLARYVAQRQTDILKEIREKVELEMRF